MSIEVPKEFECPITFDVMINPVRANCVAEKPKESASLFSRFFRRGSDDSCSGHFFEGLALAAYLRRIDQNCPTCRQKITKAIPDKELAAKITREFTNKSAAHKTHFEYAKNEVNLNYGNMKSLPIIPDDPAPEASPAAPASSSVDPSATRAPRPYRERSASDVFSHRAFDPFRPLYRARHPIRESDSTKYDSVSEHIRNDHLALAENEADRIVSSFYRNKAYQDISETHLNKYTSRLNVRRSPEHFINAGRVTSKIMDPQMKNELYYKIAQKTFPTNHLGHAERTALLITDSRLKNMALKIIAKKNVVFYLSSEMEVRIQDAERIANTLVTNNSIKQSILNDVTNAYIKKDKLEKALSTASKIQSSYARDLAYGLIAQKAASNKTYLKAYKTISKISKPSKRLGLYIKVTCKLLLFGLFKTVSFPFKLTYWGVYYLLAPFRALFRKG